ncbi:MAG: TetR/AcrR family transcriptional regulator [Planctomycetia bacterium]|nr:TetR/AcrR family transcriptional regulator [Planctomycetia bacterium]
MPRPSQAERQRKNLLPTVCQAFRDLGYRRTTTAELARRCRVRENILYRLWPDKKAMFLAAIDDVFERRAEAWSKLLEDRPGRAEAAERLVAYEAKHQGEFGFYRVVFTALAEADDDEIRGALVRMYRRFHQLVVRQIEPHGKPRANREALPAEMGAWGLIGLATVSNIVRELGLLKPRQRQAMFRSVARRLIE